MNAPIAEAYFIKQHKACCEHLRRYAHKVDNERLHRARVCVKKIKAILTIASRQHDLDLEAYYSSYRHAFHQAGVIRSETLQRDRLRELSKDSQGLTLRSHHIKGLQKEFRREIPLHLKEIEDALPDVLTALRAYDYDIQHYCSTQYGKLKKKWKRLSHSNYHKMRKDLKLFLYAASLLTREQQKKTAAPKDIRRISKLEALIGDWHDQSTISAAILDDVADHKSLQQTLKKDTARLRKKILRAGDRIWG